ncbi:MAG: hypothetical protein K2Q18_00475 [Bdellovibrionales bacterium]|nr:hypothetical protein [Bdellovibrionales bacterium]
MIKKNHIVALLTVSILSSCSTNSRHPSSTSDDDMNLEEIISAVKSTSESLVANPGECKVRYDELYNRLFNLAGDTSYLDLTNLKVIDEKIQETFLARIALKDSFKNMANNKALADECLKSATDVFRGLRYVEDYLIDIRMEKAGSIPSEATHLTGEFPYLMVNPKFKNEFKSYEDLHSGDVVLSRGAAFSSAAIARIGTNDYQFSHLAFVYKDQETRELYTTEAFIEIGSVVRPIKDHMESKNTREAVFRYAGDPDVAHRASKSVYERVLKEQLKKAPIEYDFTMNFRDDSKIFCSELISGGFKNVLPDEDYFPMFKTKFSAGTIPFLNAIGVPVNKSNVDTMEVFAPGDIQFDPRFEMVAEWRNPTKMEESRLKDFILTAMFERMDKEGYQLDATFKMEVQAKTLWLLRRTPIVKKFIQNKFPLYMTSELMEIFMVLDKVGDVIYKEIEKASLEYERPMTPKEIYTVLDRFFKQDFELYKRYKKGQDVAKPMFHLLFHP